MLDHIRRLGVTAVELLPVHRFIDDSHLLDKGLVNYWGYNSISFFALARRYASVPDFAFAEFKEMVARFHQAGIEVILDVVYNHTAEGNELGPTLSFKGIDNASYYRLLPDQPRYFINDTGTGNTLNLSHQRVCRWSPTCCATGCRRCTWTGSASTSARSWRASLTGSTRAAVFSIRAARTRSCRRSS